MTRSGLATTSRPLPYARDVLERMAAQADRLRETASAGDRKRWGQYPTSPTLARFLAGLPDVRPHGLVRVLDPGAGSGVLGVAMAEHLLATGAERVELVAVEREPHARALLEESLAFARRVLGPRLHAHVSDDDVLELGERHLGSPPFSTFDVVVANPPYFKMSPADRRGGDSPNAYTRFMAVSAKLLRPGGRMAFIVPRSFASGLYFRRFRREFHAHMSLRRVHLLASRRDAFKADGVLQETILVVYERCEPGGDDVSITSSHGSVDLDRPARIRVPLAEIHDPRDPHGGIALPTSVDDLRLLRRVRAWPHRLADFGLAISTGPVVPFRATDVLRTSPRDGAVPLLWMQHVRRHGVVFPWPALHKPQYLSPHASSILVDNRTYVLLRRFSAKEDAHRMTTAVLLRGQLPGPVLGLENHLNYIHRPGGELEPDEARGLAALLGSPVVDRYVRISNGNTQINATEIRALPLPSLPTIREIGARLAQGHAESPVVVREVLGLEG